jgi:hypothetical protein
MRLRDMLAILEENLPSLHLEWTPRNLADGRGGRTANVPRTRVVEALRNLETLPFLGEEIRTVFSRFHEVLDGPLPELVGENNQLNQFMGELGFVVAVAKGMRDALQVALPPEDELTVHFKLPRLETIDDLARALRELQAILNIEPIVDRFNSRPTLKGFDTGSCWVTIGMETADARALMLLLFTGALYLLRMRLAAAQSRRQMLEHATPDEVRILEGAFEKQDEREFAEVSQHMLPSDAKPSELAGVREGLKHMTGLVERGAEVHPALGAPKPIQEQFERAMALRRVIRRDDGLGLELPPARLVLLGAKDDEPEE